MVKRIFFFQGDSFAAYDPRPQTDRVIRSGTISGAFFGMDSEFQDGIDAAVNWGDGFVYLFQTVPADGGTPEFARYWKYNVLKNRAESPTPTLVSVGWPNLPPEYHGRIDAAFNGGQGRAYFFRDDEYLRYNIALDRVDDPDSGTAPYPRKISDPNGWRGLPASFQSGIDAAVNTANGKIYFFKDDDYVRLTFATRTADPGFPLKTTEQWSGLSADRIGTAVEWNHAGTPVLNAPATRSGCVKKADPIFPGKFRRSEAFTMNAKFSHANYPELCGCAEYRQFVRGAHTINGVPVRAPLGRTSFDTDILLQPRPAPGATDDGFREDGSLIGTLIPGINLHYGYRGGGSTDSSDVYSGPDRRTGCDYQGSDAPATAGVSGDHVTLDLDFRGVVIDRLADEEVLVERTWTVTCAGAL
jgi:hemopexin